MSLTLKTKKWPTRRFGKYSFDKKLFCLLQTNLIFQYLTFIDRLLDREWCTVLWISAIRHHELTLQRPHETSLISRFSVHFSHQKCISNLGKEPKSAEFPIRPRWRSHKFQGIDPTHHILLQKIKQRFFTIFFSFF